MHHTTRAITSKKKRCISTGNKLGWLLIDTPSYDGVHSDNWLRDRWFSVLCRSIKNDLNRHLLFLSLSSFYAVADDDSDDSMTPLHFQHRPGTLKEL